MMKVTVENSVYLMHWETRKFSPKKGNNTELELESTDCVIRRLPEKPDKRLDPVEIARGHVSQTACDQANSVTARRLSFVKAIEGLPRLLRKALGDEYNRTCRVTSGNRSQKDRKLKRKIASLQAKVKELEMAAKKEESIV